MPVAHRRAPKSALIKTGPWKSVLTTNDPLDGGPDQLLDATNCYIPDPESGSGIYARPGFTLLNGGAPVTTSASTFRGQGAFSYTDLAGTTSNFAVFNGKLFRSDAAFGVFTDVSPAGITIDAGVTTRVYGTQFITQMIVTDGVNRPWLLTNPTSTPVTGTYIDYDGSGTTWSAFGPFAVYAGSVICILNQVNNVQRRSDISWSNPGDASTGWQQLNFDFNWTLAQSEDGSAPPLLYALAGDNTGLTYWRENSIGSLSGIPGPNFQGSATHDQLSKNIGTLSPQSVKQFGTTKFFADQFGRPYLLEAAQNSITPVSGPTPLWLQMRSIVTDSTSGAFPGVTKIVCTAAFETTLNLYIIAPWSTIPSQSGPPVEGYIFEGLTGKYFGRFSIGPGIQLDTLAVFVDVDGRGTLVALGSLTAPTSSALAASGYVWGMNAVAATGDFLTTENAAPNFLYLTTEDGVLLTTEGPLLSGWLDNGQVPTISVTTPRMGYDIDTVLSVDRASALVSPGTSIAVSVMTAAETQTAEGTAIETTNDVVGRIVVGFDAVQGRGVTVTLAPTSATSQFFLEQVSLQATQNIAAPDEG